jgi:hypothetical protein
MTSADPGITFKTVLFVSAASWYGFVMGVIPMMVLERIGDFGFMWGYLVGSVTRIVVALATAGLLIKLALMPVLVVIVSLLVAYPVLLTVEVAVLAQYLGARSGASSALLSGKSQPKEALL